MKYETIQRCRGVYPVHLMCRCLRVSTSGFYGWAKRPVSAREADNRRLLVRIREHHEASDGVMGMPRMHEELTDEGETASKNRIARLMARDGLQGIPQRRQWRRKPSGIRPAFVQNHLERDFKASEPNTKAEDRLVSHRYARVDVLESRRLEVRDASVPGDGYHGTGQLLAIHHFNDCVGDLSERAGVQSLGLSHYLRVDGS